MMLPDLPALDQLFISVKRIEVTHPQCLTFLRRPDYWLAHRLASYCSHLAHPQFPLIGADPFRLTQFTAELVRWRAMILTICVIRCLKRLSTG
ncbi:hypothetical protein ACNKHU_02440 [Shigella flexneri]